MGQSAAIPNAVAAWAATATHPSASKIYLAHGSFVLGDLTVAAALRYSPPPTPSLPSEARSGRS